MAAPLAIEYQTSDGKWHQWRQFATEDEARRAVKGRLAYWRLKRGRRVLESYPRLGMA